MECLCPTLTETHHQTYTHEMFAHKINVHLSTYVLQCAIFNLGICVIVCTAAPFPYATEVFGTRFEIAILYLKSFLVAYLLKETDCIQTAMHELKWCGRAFMLFDAETFFHDYDASVESGDTEEQNGILREAVYIPMLTVFCMAVCTAGLDYLLQLERPEAIYTGCLSAVLLRAAIDAYGKTSTDTRLKVIVYVVLIGLVVVTSQAGVNNVAYMLPVTPHLVAEVIRVFVVRFLYYYITGPFFSGIFLYFSFKCQKHWRPGLLQCAHACVGTYRHFQTETLYGNNVIR